MSKVSYRSRFGVRGVRLEMRLFELAVSSTDEEDYSPPSVLLAIYHLG
jgi:hypothetical protein